MYFKDYARKHFKILCNLNNSWVACSVSMFQWYSAWSKPQYLIGIYRTRNQIKN